MSSADRVPFILNEQYVSPDLNTLQDLWARWLTDGTYWPLKKDYPAINSIPVEVSGNVGVVLGGLETRAGGGANIQIEAGVIIQLTPLVSGSNDPLTESTFAFNLAQETIAMPAPAGDTWYLVQAEAVDEDDPTVNVNIWDGVAFVSTPGQVKRKRRVISFSLKAGSATSLPALDTNQVPIAGVFRLGGGGAVNTAQIVDLRSFGGWGRGHNIDIKHNRWATNTLVPLGAAPTTIIVNARVMSDDGELSYGPATGASPTAFDPSANNYLSAGSPAFAADQWWYLYLCPVILGGQACRPTHLYPNALGEGVLVLSNVAPSASGRRTNGANMAYPRPFDGFNCPANRGVLIGAIRRNAANTGWVPMTCCGDHVRFVAPAAVSPGGTSATPPYSIFTALGGTNPLPAGAVSFDAQAVDDGSGAIAVVRLQDPLGTVQSYANFAPGTLAGALITFEDVDLTRGASYDVTATGGSSDFELDLLGYRF